jgi:ribonuclease D
MTELPPPTLVVSRSQLEDLLDTLRTEPAIAVDTESNSFYAYHERICLIQFSTPHRDAIVDPLAGLDLSPLGDLFADPTIEKIFHAATQDVAGLRRDYDFQFANLFDTMWTARILGWQRVGLADVLQEVFAVHVDKRYQRYDWGRRPLEAEALAYARMDTHYLLALRRLQAEALKSTGRAEEAAELFGQLADTPAAAPPFGPEAFWRVKGIHDLGERERAVLWELYLWRDQTAARRNRPPFRIMSDRTLVRLAHLRPSALRDLATVRGLSPPVIRRYGQALLAAIARGSGGPAPQPPPHHAPSKKATKRYEALRTWRRQVAAERQVDDDVILSNAALWALAKRNPATMRDLEGINGLGPHKRRTFGRDILRVLRGTA